jgi:glycosyltransferase involved in cell wall biosynthesis
LVTVTLSDGGAERCAATLSHFFVNQGFEVHHLVFSGKIKYDFSGELMHLAKHNSNKWYSRICRFYVLRKYLVEHDFDFVIDFRVKSFFLQEFIIHNFLYKNHIQTVHSNKLDTYIPKNKFLARLLYNKCKMIVSVSKGVEAKIVEEYQFKKTAQIYNPNDFNFINKLKEESIDFKGEFIVAAGSMNKNIKQFDHLIECYSKSELPKKNIKLLILGDGKLKLEMEELANSLGMKDFVIFKGNVQNPFSYFSKALFLVVTSKYEGLSMVLIESLSTGTPVISYNCESGPSEIINNFQNGLLVENQDKLAMIQALNNFFTDKILYLHCKKNSISSVVNFDIEKIGYQWVQLFKQIKNEN